MRILLIGNAHQEFNGARYYNSEAKLFNGFVRNGHAVQFFSPKERARAANIFRTSRLGQKKVTRDFIETVKNFKPHMTVFIHSVQILNETLMEAKRSIPGMKLVQICVDPLFRSKNVDVLKHRKAIVDASFFTTGGDALIRFATPTARATFVPNWIDPAIDTGHAFESNDQEFDVFFAARAHVGEYKGDPRFTFPLAIQSSKDLKIDFHGLDGRPPLYGTRYFEHLVKSKMALNLNGDRQGDQPTPSPAYLRYLYNSDRISQIMGAGLLAISTRDNRLFELFPEGEMMAFADSIDELLETVRKYKRDDSARRRIAEAGWRKSHAEYSVDRIARYIEEVTFEKPLSHTYQWPTTLY